MLKDTDKVRVENRDNTLVGYTVPETKIIRRFNENEVKELTMGELRQIIQDRGCRNVIKNHLIIHDKSAVEELLPGVEPEYFYNTKDVDFLLTRGSLDQLLDALDFAPEGVVNLIKEEAVKVDLNDMRKREAILEKTGFDVTKAIDIRKLGEAKDETAPKTRRAAPIGDTKDEVPADEAAPAPVRRTYSVKTSASK